MPQQTLLNYGNAYKSTSFANFPAEAWQNVLGGDMTANKTFAKVPWVYAASDLVASAVMTAPLYFVRGETEWKNGSQDAPPVDWFNDWSIMAYKLVFSALNFGAGYVNNDPADFRYLSPSSITENMDNNGRLKGFDRSFGNGFFVSIKPEDIVHFWWFKDPLTEVGRAKLYPASVALDSGNVLHSYQELLRRYFESGAVGVKALQSPMPPNPEEAQALKTWWGRVVGGVKNAFGTGVLNPDAKVMKISDNLSEFYDTAVVENARRDVEVAFGLPETMLNQAANLATKQADQIDFLSNVIEPICDWLATTINQQAAVSLRGYRAVYRLDELQAMQRDENEVSKSVLNYVAAGYGREITADLLGVDLNDEQRAKIQEVDKLAWNNLILQLTDLGGTSRRRDPEEPDLTNLNQDTAVSMRAVELGQLERWVANRLSRGKAVNPDDFNAEHLTPDEVKTVVLRETANAEDTPFPTVTTTNTTKQGELGTPDGTLTERHVRGRRLVSLQKEFERLLEPQLRGFPKRSALQQIGIEALRQMAEQLDTGSSQEIQGQINTAVVDNLPALSGTQYESDPKPEIIAALLGFGAIGVQHEKGNLPATQLTIVQSELTRYTAERMASLVGEPTSGNYPYGQTIENPHLDEPLDTGTAVLITLAIIAALRGLKERGDNVTYSAIEAAMAVEMARRLLNRAGLIGENEAGRMINAGQYLTAVARGATAKRWLETTSKQPRPIHLAQVGQVVPINGRFANGNSWAGEEINCKCGIEVIYDNSN